MRMFAERSKQPLEKKQTPDLSQETETKVVWPYVKVFWLSKDDPAGHSARKTEGKIHRRRGGKTILSWTGMDFAS